MEEVGCGSDDLEDVRYGGTSLAAPAAGRIFRFGPPLSWSQRQTLAARVPARDENLGEGGALGAAGDAPDASAAVDVPPGNCWVAMEDVEGAEYVYGVEVVLGGDGGPELSCRRGSRGVASLPDGRPFFVMLIRRGSEDEVLRARAFDSSH